MTRAILPDQITDMILQALDTRGDKRAKWLRLIGPIYALPPVERRRTGWTVISGGSSKERAAINAASASVRERFPYIPRPQIPDPQP